MTTATITTVHVPDAPETHPTKAKPVTRLASAGLLWGLVAFGLFAGGAVTTTALIHTHNAAVAQTTQLTGDAKKLVATRESDHAKLVELKGEVRDLKTQLERAKDKIASTEGFLR